MPIPINKRLLITKIVQQLSCHRQNHNRYYDTGTEDDNLGLVVERCRSLK